MEKIDEIKEIMKSLNVSIKFEEVREICDLVDAFIVGGALIEDIYITRIEETQKGFIIYLLENIESGYAKGHRFDKKVLEIEYFIDKDLYWIGLYKKEWYSKVNDVSDFWGNFIEFDRLMKHLKIIFGVKKL